MFKQFLVGVLFLAASAAGAQRVRTTPDLTTLTQNAGAKLAVDSRSGWIYASGFSSRALGVPFAGLARVSPGGVPDVSWQPTGLTYTYSHVVGINGDVYVLGRQDSDVIQLFRYSGTRGGEPVIRYTIPPFASTAGSINRDMRVDEIFGGRDHWLYLSVYDANEARWGQRIMRIDTRTDRFDPQWVYDITGGNQGSPILGPDGALYVAGVTSAPQAPQTWTITRVDEGNSATIRWTSKFVAGTLTAAADASGRLYVMTRVASNAAASTAVTRLNAAGVIDSTWNGAGASLAMSQSVLNTRMRSQGGDLFVTATPNVPARRGGIVIVRFDDSGVERARWTKAGVSAADQPNVFVESSGGDLYANTSGDLYVLDPTTLSEKRSLPLAFGPAGIAGRALKLPDGGYLLFGQFDVWFDGRRYRDVLRTHDDGTPDASWRVETNGSLVRATITSRGVVLEGAFSSVNGVANSNGVALVSLAPGAAVEPGWGAEWINFGYNTPFDGQAYFYTVAYDNASSAIRRVALANGRFDPVWSIPLAPPTNDEHVISLAYDAAGGVWMFSGVESFGSSKTTTIQRFDSVTKRQTLRMAAGPSQSYTRTLVSDERFAYIGSQRYTVARGGEPDSTWNLARSYLNFESPLHAITPKYLYFVDNAKDDTSATLLRRALLSGNGAADPDWSVRPRASTSGLVDQVLSLITQTANPGSDDIEYLIAQRTDRYVYSNSAIATSRNAPATEKIVIEYFNRDAGRYFVTGRASEQATLDALPASFQRTGMVFTAKSSEYRDVPEQPVCRFYAAPESGGSNTHFYGTGDDCPVLNTVRQVRFEGFDFAAIKPTSGMCLAAAPNTVFRLFNNQSATNQGNHRFVVSAATKSRMIARGWVDEGAVFCSTSVTDAVN